MYKLDYFIAFGIAALTSIKGTVHHGWNTYRLTGMAISRLALFRLSKRVYANSLMREERNVCPA